MNHQSFRAALPPLYRLCLAALLALPFAPACSDDEAAPPLPLAFALEITSLDPSADQPLSCDAGLAVHVAVSSGNALAFTLRPSHACGQSNRCGYLRFEALDAGGEVLDQVDSVTTVGLLMAQQNERLADLAEVRVSLIRGVDDEPLINADGEAVQATVEVASPAPTQCPAGDLGSGGAGGQSGAGGAGGEPAGSSSAGASNAGAPGGGGVASSNGGAGGVASSNGGAGGVASSNGGAGGAQ